MPLDFDPIERAGNLWSAKVGDASSMKVATSIMRIQQLLLSEFDRVLKPHGLSFSRYEVLRLISFSKQGRLSLGLIGERLMVHPASVTNAIDRLVADHLVERTLDPGDRRRTFASLTAKGAKILDLATEELMRIDFGLQALTRDQREKIFTELSSVRAPDWQERHGG